MHIDKNNQFLLTNVILLKEFNKQSLHCLTAGNTLRISEHLTHIFCGFFAKTFELIRVLSCLSRLNRNELELDFWSRVGLSRVHPLFPGWAFIQFPAKKRAILANILIIEQKVTKSYD